NVRGKAVVVVILDRRGFLGSDEVERFVDRRQPARLAQPVLDAGAARAPLFEFGTARGEIEADLGDVARLGGELLRVDEVAQPDRFVPARLEAPCQLAHDAVVDGRVGGVVVGGAYPAPRQRVVERALAFPVRVDGGRKHDVRHHAAVLGAVTRDPEELRHGQLQLPEIDVVATVLVERHQVLHGTLAEGRLADDQASTVVLDRAGEDLRCRGGVTIHHDRQGPRVADRRVGVDVDADAPGAVANLDDGAAVDEESGQGDRLGQRSAAVAAQVHDQGVDVLPLEFADQLANVLGGAAVLGVAVAAPFEIRVDSGHGDHAELVGAPAVLDFLDGFVGRLFLEVDLVAGDGDDPGLA